MSFRDEIRQAMEDGKYNYVKNWLKGDTSYSEKTATGLINEFGEIKVNEIKQEILDEQMVEEIMES